jgi:hypothetical protein
MPPIDTSCQGLAPYGQSFVIFGRVSGYKYCLLESAGLRNSFTPRESKQIISRQFIVGWDFLDAFMLDFGGCCQWAPPPEGGGNATYTTWLPAQFPGKPWLAVSHISADPLGAPDDICGYDQTPDSDGVPTNLPIPTNGYRVSVTYETKKYFTNYDDHNIPNGIALEIRTDFGANALLLPTPGLSWVNESITSPPTPTFVPLTQQVNITKFEPTQTIDMIWCWVPYPAWTTIQKLIGAINIDTFFGLPARTVMLAGCQAEPAMLTGDPTSFNKENTGINPNNPDGALTVFRLRFRFAVRQVPLGDSAGSYGGWNYFFNPKPKDPSAPSNYQQVVSTQTQEDIFPEEDFYKLFTIGTDNSFNFGAPVAAVNSFTLVIGQPFVQ